MTFEEKVRNYIRANRIFKKGERIAVACSGGADSLSLLNFLKEEKFEIECVYIHHHLRASADLEWRKLRDFCDEKKIPFTKIDVRVKSRVKEKKESVEEAARNLRYEALLKISCDKIAIAHHKNDQAETVLFQMLRGSSLKGLSGMRPLSEKIARPFLCVTKEEILQYAGDRKLSWSEDETNEDRTITRNRIRKEIIPALQKVREDAVDKIADAAEDFYSCYSYFEEEAGKWLRKNAREENGNVFLPTEKLQKKQEVIRRFIYRETMKKAGFTLKDKTRKHLSAIDALLGQNVGKSVSLGSYDRCSRTYADILFQSGRKCKTQNFLPVKIEKAETEKEILLNGETYLLKTKIRAYRKTMKIPRGDYKKWFDYDTITDGLLFRMPEEGDMLSLPEGKHKKLNRYFIDKKVFAEERKTIPVLACAGDILWVFKGQTGDRYKITGETKKIFEIELRKISRL